MALRSTENQRTPTAFEISQLHDKPAAHWERKLREMDEQKNYRVLEYLPLRKAIVAELEVAGTGSQILLRELEGYNSGFSTDAMVATMKTGFATFMDKQRKFVTAIYSENVKSPQPFRVRLGGGDVKVALHAVIEHSRYGRKSLFIYASKYSPAEVNALQELLGMVPEQRDNGRPEDILWLDIRSGKLSKLKSRTTVRSSLADTVNLYNKLF